MKYARCGIEIEGVFNGDILCDVEPDGYHNNQHANMWRFEHDTSIEHDINGPSRFNMRAELITPVLDCDFNTIKDGVLNWLYENGVYNRDKINTLELCDIVRFNKSCGAHINFSLRNKDLSFIYNDTFIKRFNDTFKREMYALFGDVFCDTYFKLYYRYYAKKHAKFTRDKYYSIRAHNNRLEFRGIHLNGVTTWGDFKGVFDCWLKACFYTCTHTQTRKRVLNLPKIEQQKTQKNSIVFLKHNGGGILKCVI